MLQGDQFAIEVLFCNKKTAEIMEIFCADNTKNNFFYDESNI